MRDLNKLAAQIRLDGRKNGWTPIEMVEWATSNERVPTFLALIHSEICEAYAETAADSGDPFLASELADILIRVLDLVGGLTNDFAIYARFAPDGGEISDAPDAEKFMSLHQLTTDALEAFRRGNKVKFLGALGILYQTTCNIAMHSYMIDINKAIDTKMKFNRSRSYRNGNKRV